MTQPQKNEPATAMAGPVRVTNRNYPSRPVIRVERAYTDAELSAIIKQGQDRPRPLTAEQTELAARNRAQAAGDAQAMERWYSEQCKEALRGPRVWVARHPGPGEVWSNKEKTLSRSARWR